MANSLQRAKVYIIIKAEICHEINFGFFVRIMTHQA